MRFTEERTEDGVTERLFELTVAGDVVPGALWTAEGAAGPRPIVLVGHGGGQHKKAPPIVGGAKRFVKSLGVAVVALDAPDHGARVAPADAPAVAQRERDRIQQAGGMRGAALDAAMARAAQATPEWSAALDAVQSLADVGTGGRVGYLGISMGAMQGIHLVAREPRITAAVLGLAGAGGDAHPLAESARKITVPIELVVQWDDELVPRDAALALFDAFGSREKTLHVNPGGHGGLPPFERAGWERFFARHLVDGAAG